MTSCGYIPDFRHTVIPRTLLFEEVKSPINKVKTNLLHAKHTSGLQFTFPYPVKIIS